MRQHLYVVPGSQPGRLGGFSSITWHQVRQRGHNVAASSCWRRGQPGSPDDPWGPSWSGLHCHCAPQTGHIMVEKVRGRSLLTPCPARAVAASDLWGLQGLERRGWTRVRGFNHIMAIAAFNDIMAIFATLWVKAQNAPWDQPALAKTPSPSVICCSRLRLTPTRLCAVRTAAMSAG